MKIELISEMSKAVNDATYERKEYKLTDGSDLEVLYYITRDVTVYGDQAPLVRYYSEPQRDSYMPSIYYHDDFFGRSEPRFEVQTTSYGALKADEFSVFVAAQVKALEVVNLLTETFLKEEA